VQACPHAPQFAGSLAVVTQAVPQASSPVGQPHTPLVQLCPLGQVIPQPPQLNGSLPIVFTHAPPVHCVNAHVAEHTPEVQNGAALPQTTPHAPQFMASDWVLMQPVEQALSGAAHAHTLASQLVPTPQALPHAPQLASSLAALMQLAPQAMNEVPSAAQLQLPFTHCCIGPQATAQDDAVEPPVPMLAAPPFELVEPGLEVLEFPQPKTMNVATARNEASSFRERMAENLAPIPGFPKRSESRIDCPIWRWRKNVNFE
jgi:hypothetical protein